MKKELVITGKTIDEAIAAGCAELGVERDAVSVEVLATPARGFLGFGAIDAKVRLTYEVIPPDPGADFLKEIFKVMDLEVTITSEKTEDALKYTMEGPEMGLVIGRRGETLDALQYLTGFVVNRAEKEHQRVVLDTENYRAKRESALTHLARRTASRVVKYRRAIALEAMNPHERRIIHSALQDFKGVTTGSVGVEPNRRVVISPEGGSNTEPMPLHGASQRAPRPFQSRRRPAAAEANDEE